MASNLSRRRGEIMTTEEMQSLTEQLMASDNPYTSPSGRKTFITFRQRRNTQTISVLKLT